MDRFDMMKLFVRVVERRSFTAAASDLVLPRSTATEAIRRLEEQLGARLLERTTRHVAPTPEGHAYYERCVQILADIDDAEGHLRGAEPGGLVRVDAPGLLTRTFLLPQLRHFLGRYPAIELQFGQRDRLVDLVREGVDCAIRAGEPTDSSLIQRRLATIPEVTVASPAYLERYGTPRTLADLDGHRMVGFISSRSGDVLPLEFMEDSTRHEIALPVSVSADDSNTTAEFARLGFGLLQAPRYRFARELADGTLIEVLPDHPPTPTPLFALYPQNRQVAARVRVFLDWIGATFRAAQL
jgi:DNA-binding transcriptional LysR family regulator